MSKKTTFTNVYEDLEWRGLVHEATSGAADALRSPVTCYVGFDVTSPSLHIGHLLSLVGMLRFKQYGHKSIALIGGFTSLIGDPSGKDKERTLQDRAAIEQNSAAIRRQITSILGEGEHIKVLNNADWLTQVSLADFLRDTGKHITINTMLKRTSVKNRLERESGISFAEFSYQLIQAYDFLHLYDHEQCTFQMGGSDQWGNIMSGVELIGHKHHLDSDARHATPHGIVYPLITTASGAKLGKSETNHERASLDAGVTSPYQLYQFLYNTADADVIAYLKMFTFLAPGEVDELSGELKNNPAGRAAQQRLASEITQMVHGEAELKSVLSITRMLFDGDIKRLTAQNLLDVFGGAPSSTVARARLSGADGKLTIGRLLADNNILKSVGEVRRTISQGGLYLNEARVTDTELAISENDLIDNAILVIRRGKRDYHIVKFE